MSGPRPAVPAMATTDGDGYSKIGPGPIAAIRFKWTARRGEDGGYFVDETIGESSAPMTHGPMSRDDAIAMVDEREVEARRSEQAQTQDMPMAEHAPDPARQR